MSSQKLMQFWESLHGREKHAEGCTIEDLERGMSCMRIYRNNDGTWALMPNWFNGQVDTHKRPAAITYETFENIPVDIQEKLAVLLLKEPGGEWLTGIGKRIDDGVFWLEDG